ncbi:MAG: hypothetical protein WKF97_23175 [Chitinophagaceae bacterium]
MADKTAKTTITKVDNVIADYLYKSDFYQIKNWAFDFKNDKQLSSGYNDCLCVVFVKKGNFLFNQIWL